MPLTLLSKQKGEWAEVCFAAEILRRGWRISRPYGDSCRYDCIVDVCGQLSRVQVKSVYGRDAGRKYPYRVKMIRGKHVRWPYTSRDVDFMAVLVVPRSRWYIVPLVAVEGRSRINFSGSAGAEGPLEHYAEAWDLFVSPLSPSSSS